VVLAGWERNKTGIKTPLAGLNRPLNDAQGVMTWAKAAFGRIGARQVIIAPPLKCP